MMLHSTWEWLKNHWAAIAATLAFGRSWYNGDRLQKVKLNLNGRFDSWMKTEKEASYRQGLVEGKVNKYQKKKKRRKKVVRCK